MIYDFLISCAKNLKYFLFDEVVINSNNSYQLELKKFIKLVILSICSSEMFSGKNNSKELFTLENQFAKKSLGFFHQNISIGNISHKLSKVYINSLSFLVLFIFSDSNFFISLINSRPRKRLNFLTPNEIFFN